MNSVTPPRDGHDASGVEETVAAVLRAFPGSELVIEPPANTGLSELAAAALGYAAAGWEIFPLHVRGKLPLISKLEGGHGHLDATADADQVRRWWATYPLANIGGRVPAGLIVLDIDPRHGGDDAVADLQAAHGPLPSTLTSTSGRGDGGTHLYFVHPGGEVSGTRLPAWT